MENQKKSSLKKTVEDEIKLSELMSVEGGNDTDSDEDWCIVGQCYQGAQSNYCESNA